MKQAGGQDNGAYFPDQGPVGNAFSGLVDQTAGRLWRGGIKGPTAVLWGGAGSDVSKGIRDVYPSGSPGYAGWEEARRQHLGIRDAGRQNMRNLGAPEGDVVGNLQAQGPQTLRELGYPQQANIAEFAHGVGDAVGPMAAGGLLAKGIGTPRGAVRGTSGLKPPLPSPAAPVAAEAASVAPESAAAETASAAPVAAETASAAPEAMAGTTGPATNAAATGSRLGRLGRDAAIAAGGATLGTALHYPLFMGIDYLKERGTDKYQQATQSGGYDPFVQMTHGAEQIRDPLFWRQYNAADPAGQAKMLDDLYGNVRPGLMKNLNRTGESLDAEVNADPGQRGQRIRELLQKTEQDPFGAAGSAGGQAGQAPDAATGGQTVPAPDAATGGQSGQAPGAATGGQPAPGGTDWHKMLPYLGLSLPLIALLMKSGKGGSGLLPLLLALGGAGLFAGSTHNQYPEMPKDDTGKADMAAEIMAGNPEAVGTALQGRLGGMGTWALQNLPTSLTGPFTGGLSNQQLAEQGVEREMQEVAKRNHAVLDMQRTKENMRRHGLALMEQRRRQQQRPAGQ